jgi:DeoR family transcriptional regulator, fructose operon transcriptional repressor
MNGQRKLLPQERETLILQALGAGMRAIVDLSEELGVSEATVRRDLDSLEEQGKARRVHGGAMRVKFPRTEPVFDEKAAFHAVEKKHIAESAIEFIEDGDTIFLDGGSTLTSLAKLLERRNNLTVVTNSLIAASELMESSHRLILVGGEFRSLSRTMVGPLTSRIIKSLSISKAFMGTIGFTVTDGISTTDPNEAYTKETVMNRAEKVFLLVDSSKIGTPSFAVSGTTNDIDVLITDSGISAEAVAALKKKNIEIVI